MKPVQKSYRSGVGMHYRTNYTPSDEVPGYIRAQQNAEREGIGFDDAQPVKPQQSAWQTVRKEPSASAKLNVIPVDYQQSVSQMETVATPAPRPIENSVLSAAPSAVNYGVAPAIGSAPIMDDGCGCGAPCEMGCDSCGPCDACGPCGPWGWGPGWGGGCGMWPGLIPLAADAVRFTGRAAFRTGRAAVIGTGMVAAGSVRTVGRVLWNRPLPAPMFAGPMYAGPVAAAPAPVGDPIYAQNDYYLNASYAAPAQTSAIAASNLYENNYYPQNYVPESVPTMVPTAVPTGIVSAPAVVSAPAAVPAPQQQYASNDAGTAGLLSVQTQHVFTDDGTEVILEHDFTLQNNPAYNSSVQYASAAGNSATGNAVAENAVASSGTPLKAAAAIQTVSYGNSQTASVPAQNVPVQNVPVQNVPVQNVPVQNVSPDGYPIVSMEAPQIQLAPGEVLVSQEDFVLQPAGPSGLTTEPAKSTETPVFVQPVKDAAPAENAPQPIQDSKVTKVSFVQPVAYERVERETVPEPVTLQTESGWEIVQPTEKAVPGPSLLDLKAATPL